MVPRGHSALADQLRRAAMSVPLNIAETQGRTGEADRARRYIGRTLGILGEEMHGRGIELLERVAAMLTKLC